MIAVEPQDVVLPVEGEVRSGRCCSKTEVSDLSGRVTGFGDSKAEDSFSILSSASTIGDGSPSSSITISTELNS